MKKLLRKFLRKLYYFAFPEIPNKEAFICSMGNKSKIYNQAIIYNPSGDKNNIVIGDNTHIAGNLSVCSNAGKIIIGDNSFVGENSRVWSAKSIIIGSRVQIAHGCNI
jgi:carbonic anhydrase/acetyltransferase-like protein (isoleucine patch superfamily)